MVHDSVRIYSPFNNSRDTVATILCRLFTWSALKFVDVWLPVTEATVFRPFLTAGNQVLVAFLRVWQNMAESGVNMVRKYHQKTEIKCA